MTAPSPALASGLAQRLAAVAAVLLPGEPAGEPGATLDALVRSIQTAPDWSRLWLLWSAVSTVLPDEAQLRTAGRRLELLGAAEAAQWLLTACLDAAQRGGAARAELLIVSEEVVVDVDASARRDLHTGIQRVVRSLLPRWHAEHAVRPVAWTAGRGALRTLQSGESARVLRWFDNRSTAAAEEPLVLVLPWRSTLVLAEVPGRDVCARLTALARYSGNRTVAIGYDCIPVISADLVPAAESNRFVRYLGVVKHVDAVAAISLAVAGEFAGFRSMLGAQGIPGPEVIDCVLPVDVGVNAIGGTAAGSPVVLCVGRLEPRKNQLAVLDAAERLWREGHDFRLRFIGGGSQDAAVTRQLQRLAEQGRPVSHEADVSEAELAAAYAQARFSVFVSLHEGYGLPLAESLAHGTPVLTAELPSTAELAAAGGAITVDPADDDAVVTAMRRLLTDDVLLAELRSRIAARPSRSWDDYAAELWQIAAGR